MSEEIVKNEETVITAEEAMKIIEAERIKREEACVKEVNEVLAKHGFAMSYQVAARLSEIKK